MKCVILSTLLVGAAAFAPAQTGKASTALAADLTAEVGAQAPLGCFDPLGVLGDPKDGDQEQFDNLRYIELKHGRVAMLAFVGYIVTYVSLMLRADIFAYPFICDYRYFHVRFKTHIRALVATFPTLHSTGRRSIPWSRGHPRWICRPSRRSWHGVGSDDWNLDNDGDGEP